MPSMLSDAEIAFLKAELGYNVLSIGAEPYVGITSLFTQVVQANVFGGAETTSTTTVAASSAPAPVAITLASATGFAAGDRVVIDVDSRQETATLQSLSGAAATFLLSLAHSGTYPVAQESPLTLVRHAMSQIRRINGAGGILQSAAAQSGIKKVDEVEFFGDGTAGTQFKSKLEALTYWRNFLANLIGVENRNGVATSGGGARFEVY